MQTLRIKYLAIFLSLPILFGCSSNAENNYSGERMEDIDGNQYHTVTIGNLTWMAEDLKTTRYSDGTPIPKVENYDQWANLDLPAYCWYNNDSVSKDAYGALYNWYVVESGKLCPDGWHVPSDEEWIEIEITYGGAGTAGSALKESGNIHWKPPNIDASNESGFSALPGGYRSYNGTYNLQLRSGYWWSASTKSWYGSASKAVYRSLRHDSKDLSRNIAEYTNGFSVRCVKDK